MELSTIKLHNMSRKGQAESQITLDDDYNVPDYRPDIIRIIRQQGEIKLDEVKPALGAVWVKGKLVFRVLYRSDQENGKLSCLKGELPFQEKINIEGMTEYEPVRVTGEIEDLTVGVIHSRKLNLRAIVVLHAFVESSDVQEITTGLEWEESCRQRQKEVEVSELLFVKHDTCRQRNEIVLPSSKPNIREILWKSVELRNVGNRLDEEGIHLSGEVLLSILYQEEEETDRIQWYETTLPLECTTEIELENGKLDENVFYKIQIDNITKEVEVKPDYDGEERMLVLDMLIHMYVRAWREQAVEILEDVYSLEKNLQPSWKTVTLERFLIKNDALCKVTEQIELDENQEKILQICSCEGKAYIDRTEQRQNGIFVEGTLEVHLLYITTNDQMPVGAAYKLYPFEQLIELPQTKLPVRIEQECNMVQLSAAMLDQSRAEVKAVIGVNVLAFIQESFEHITEVKEEEFNVEELLQMPGVVGYVVNKEDTLWNIAKRYHTTVEAIMEINQRKNEELQVGEKLLIVKGI